MPHIRTQVSVPLTKDAEDALTAAYGKIITLIPGKTEAYLMLSFEGDCHIRFAGTDDRPAAWVEVQVLGKLGETVAERMTAAICTLLEEKLGIPGDRVYVKYEEVQTWGWNGGNF